MAHYISVIRPTASATANTHNTSAHGLVDGIGRPIAPTSVSIRPNAANATTVAETVAAHVVSSNATNVVWKANAASAVVEIIARYDAPAFQVTG